MFGSASTAFPATNENSVDDAVAGRPAARSEPSPVGGAVTTRDAVAVLLLSFDSATVFVGSTVATSV